MQTIKMPGKKELMHELRQICPLKELKPLWVEFAQLASKEVTAEGFAMSWRVAVDQFCWETNRPDWYRRDLLDQLEAIRTGLLPDTVSN